MFYVKERISDTVSIKTQINDGNVYCTCPACGKEVQVDLEEVFADEELDLMGTTVLCDECSKKVLRKEG